VPHVEITREVVRRFNTSFGLQVSGKFFQDEPALRRVMELGPQHLRRESYEPYDSVYVRSAHAAATESGIANYLEALGKFRHYFSWKEVLHEPGHLLTETPRLPGLDGRRMAKSYGNAIWLSDTPDEIRTKVRNMMTDPQRQRRTDPGRPEICPVFAYHKLFSPADTVAQVDRDCRTAAIGCVDCKKLMADGLVKWIEPVQARRKEFENNPRRVWDILDAGNKKARKAAVRTMKRVRNAIFKWDEARKSTPA
jgi:tryptophanyl-tRNA synthetase